jgi:hypothetical protein
MYFFWSFLLIFFTAKHSLTTTPPPRRPRQLHRQPGCSYYMMMMYCNNVSIHVQDFQNYSAVCHLLAHTHPIFVCLSALGTMAQFLFKFLDYIASDIIVKRLANSKTFQRFALHTDKMVQNQATKGEQIMETVSKKAEEVAANPHLIKQKIPKMENSRINKYMRAFADEVKKDLGSLNK